MELNRRDVVAALGAAGVAVGAGGAALSVMDGDEAGSETAENDDGPISDHDRRTLVAAAETLYPSELDGIEAFVTEYVDGRAADRPAHAAGMADAAAYLDEYTAAWYDEDRFAELDPATRSEALRQMNVDTTEPDPEGGDVERVRYYVVNELQFALYSTPTGGELVGIENPQGHPGGTTSYQRGPQEQ
jgi:hypothetical protein